LGFPTGLAVDSAGNVYVADYGNDQILKITPAGNLSVFAGGGPWGSPIPGPATESDLRTPIGVATDNAGNVYISDTGNHVVEKVNAQGDLSIVAGDGIDGEPTPGPATQSALGTIAGVGVDPDNGDIYIADVENSKIEQVVNGTLTIVAGDGGLTPVDGSATSSGLAGPWGVAVLPSAVLVADGSYLELLSAGFAPSSGGVNPWKQRVVVGRLLWA
jgi:sugar lactone lactonase YvrE